MAPDLEYSIYIHAGDKTMLQNIYDLILIPNFLFEDISGIKFDLIINTLSFAEMPASVVETYAEGMAKILNDDGIVFEQNFNCDHYGLPTFCNPESILQKHFSDQVIVSKYNRWGQASIWSKGAPGERRWAEVETSAFHPSPLLFEIGYKGFNLILFQCRCIGLSRSLGEVNPSILTKDQWQDLERRDLVRTGDTPETVKSLIDLLP